jgi:hypothetical protein
MVDPSGLLLGIPGTPSASDLINSVAGFGDAASLGARKWARQQLGDDNVDYCSSSYSDGSDTGQAFALLVPGKGEEVAAGSLGVTAAKSGGFLDRLVVLLTDETGAVGRYGNLGNLADRLDETVADVIRSRGGGASQVQQLESGYGQLTLGELSDLAARGDRQAVKAIEMAKQAGSQGKGGS